MSIKKTLLIAIIFFAAAGYYYFDQQRIKKNDEVKQTESKLIAAKKEALTDIMLQHPDQTIKLKKKGDKWRLTEPIAARTDPAAVEELLKELDQAKKDEPFAVEPDKLGDYGLATAPVKVEVQAAGEKYVEKFELGDKTTDNNSLYGRLNEGKNVFTLPVSLETHLTKKANDFRDRRLLPANLNEATSITLAYNNQLVEAVKHSQDWNMLSPRQSKADAAKVSEMLSALNNAKIADFLDTSSEQLSQYGLDNPVWKGTFLVQPDDQATTANLTLLIGDKPTTASTNRWAMQAGVPVIFTVTDETLDKIRPSYDELRDKKLFSLAADNVSRASIRVKEKTFNLVRNAKREWQLDGDSQTRLDQEIVNSKIRGIAGLKATRFFDAPPPADTTGLDNPNLSLSLVAGDGQTTETVQTGRIAQEGEFVFARRVNTGEIVGVDMTQPGEYFITLEDLLDRTTFEFDEAKIKKIDLLEGGKKITLTQNGQTWTAQPEGSTETYQVNTTEVSSLLFAMSTLKWKRHLDPRYPENLEQIKKQGLENPTRDIVLYDAGGNELARLGQGSEDERHVYIRRSVDNYYAIDKTKFVSLRDAINTLIGALKKQ